MGPDYPDEILFDSNYHELKPPFPSLPGAELLSRTWHTPSVWRNDLGTGEVTVTLEHWVGADGRFYSDLGGVPTDDSPRAYRGVWKLENGLLFLASIQGRFRLAVDGPVFADWYTGEVSFTFRTDRIPALKTVTRCSLCVAIENGREISRQRTDMATIVYEAEEFRRDN